LEPSDFSSLSISNQPIVRITAVWMIHHYFQPIVDVVSVLRSLANTIELRQSCGVESLEIADRRFGYHQSRICHIKIVPGMDGAWKRVHQYSMTRRGLQVNHDVPVSTDQIVDPVVVRHDDAAVLRPASGCNKRGTGRWRRLMQFRIVSARILERRDVVERKLHPPVHCKDVISVHLDAARECTARYAGDFLLILIADLVPEQIARGVSVELPIVIRYVLQIFLEDSQRLTNLFCKEPTVLISDFFRRALEVQVDPSPAFGAAGF